MRLRNQLDWEWKYNIMAKLDEIMEVLTQEISGFNNSIGKLEELSTKFDDLKITADTSHLEFQLKDFLRLQKINLEFYNKRMDEVLKNIEKSRWTPKWEMLILYLFIIMNTSALGYMGYYFINYERKKKAEVLKVKKESLGRARGYFEDHPIIYKDFEKWVQKQDSVLNPE